MLKGIDISNWQKNIIPSNLNIDFCICKATEGTWFVDKFCDAFIQNCKAKCIPWGFYHFAQTASPYDEAKYFYDNCKGYIRHGIPVLDYEVWGLNDDVLWCEQFISKFHDLSGVWPLLYISASHCKDFQDSWIPNQCGLWVAGYPNNATTWGDSDIPYDISPWSFAAMWQFTSALQLPDYNGSLDGDYAYMDAKAWAKYAGSSTETDRPANEKKKVSISIDDKKYTGWIREK